jgi:transposase-like protein
MKKKSYTTEFKIQALELVKQTGSYSEAARQLGIGDNLLHAWKKRFNFSLETKGKSAAQAVAETEEVRRLKKQIQDLEKTNYILKKAAAFFSQDHLK